MINRIMERKVNDESFYRGAVAANTDMIGEPNLFTASNQHRIHFFNLGQGDQINQRQGNKILAKGIKLKYTIRPQRYGAGVYYGSPQQTIRVMIVMDRNQSQAAPTIDGDILEGNATVTSPFGWPIARTNQVNTFINKRYKVLYDKLHKLVHWGDTSSTSINNQYGITSSTDWAITKTKYIKLNKVIDYNGTNPNQYGKNHVYMYIFGDWNLAYNTFSYDIGIVTRQYFFDN